MPPTVRTDIALIISTILLSLATIAGAQDTKPAITRPATTTDGAIVLKGRITGVRGLVEVKVTETSPWAPAKEGMIVDEGGEFRTGPRSAVQIVIEPDQIITLDRLGTIKLVTAVRQASGKTKTDIGMKYGRTRYDISAGGLEHESTIRSPNSTLAVRGTKVSLTDTRPFPPEAVSLIGRAEFQSFKREVVAFGGKNKAKIDSSAGNAASTAFNLAILDPSIAMARDPAEAALIADVISRGATVTLDRETGFRTVSGGTVPNDKQLLSLLPGSLNFVLRWDGNANLDLIVSSQTGGFLYPNKELFFNSEGGKIPFDHQGGPNGGFEIATYPANFPRGSFGVGVNHVSGPTVNATLNTYLNGQPVPILTFDNEGNPIVNTTITIPVSHIPPELAVKHEATLLGIVDLSQVPSGPGVAARVTRPRTTPSRGR
jgi:hypothetical protein